MIEKMLSTHSEAKDSARLEQRKQCRLQVLLTLWQTVLSLHDAKTYGTSHVQKYLGDAVR